MRRYVCPLALARAEFDKRAQTFAAGLYWEAPTSSPGPDTMVLFQVEWGSIANQDDFENQVGVTPLGEPWEAVAVDAVPALEALRQNVENSSPDKPLGAKSLAPTQDTAAAIDETHTVSQALRKAVPHLMR